MLTQAPSSLLPAHSYVCNVKILGGRNYEQCVCAEFKRSHFPKEDLSRRKLEALVAAADDDDVSVMPPTTEREWHCFGGKK